MTVSLATIAIFPQILQCLHHTIPGRAIADGKVAIPCWNPRDYCEDKHRTVDDRPYGGGPGMVMKVEPLRRAISAAKTTLPNAKVIYLSPQGQPFSQQVAQQWAAAPHDLILIAGRYEGIDERLLDNDIDEEWSIGDYVLSGGELAAAIIIDALTRLLPGVLGDAQSAAEDSFSHGLLDYPHYTRPEKIDGKGVPDVLLSGDHAAIARWRLQQSLGRTWLKRPNLLKEKRLNEVEKELLAAFIKEYHQDR